MRRVQLVAGIVTYCLAASSILFSKASAAEAVPYWECEAGGQYATSCYISDLETGFECQVSCAPGKYACCSAKRMECSCKSGVS